ncbi:hypothetical protein ABLO27_23065 [Roseibium sp. SCPC15]|uniref:hypothetical protein n=1 Tax=Roseibium sp. SCP15 TaxID=3141376 RepID=UPI00333AE1E3
MPKFALMLVAAATSLCFASPAQAFLSGEDPDSYFVVEEPNLQAAYLEALVAAGESSTGKLHAFRIDALGDQTSSDTDTPSTHSLTVHAVQDRGLPRGTEYPTFVFTSDRVSETPALIYKTHAGTRLFVADPPKGEDVCLLSAEKGWSDVCLVDSKGNPAPDLPGLRDDFWSDLMKVFGL